MFHCVLPTRSGRQDLLTWSGSINLKNSKYQKDTSPLDENCKLRNLTNIPKLSKSPYKTNELLASMLISLNNINFYQQFTLKMRN